MKTKRNSPDYSFEHTKKRLKERYDLEITRKEYDILNKTILLWDRSPDHLEKDGGELQGIFSWIFKEQQVRFVYSYTHSRIKTVLPKQIKIPDITN